jgi:hypothetical protein
LSFCLFLKQTAGQQETKRVCLNKTTTFAREAVAFFNGLRLKQQQSSCCRYPARFETVHSGF